MNPRPRRAWGLAVLAMLPAAMAHAAGEGAGPAPTNLPAADLRTDHYDLHVEGADARDVGAMLEQLHGQLRGHFGTAPRERLTLALYATRDRWARALQADGQFVPPNAGGYYAPGPRKVYAWAQPSAYFTRHVLIHEATHQFHWLAATGNATPSAPWYYEGLAEYFGMHDWDGRRLRTGVVPAVTLEDYPAAALACYQAAGGALERLRASEARPAAWALVAFLRERHGEAFGRLAGRLDRGEDAAAAWAAVFGGVDGLSRELGAWLGEHRQPWQVVWTAWQQRGEALESESPTMSITILKQTPGRLSVRVEPQGPGEAAGLVFGYRSPDDFYLFQALPGGLVRVLRRREGAWAALGAPVPVKDSSVLSVAPEAAGTALWAGGTRVALVDAVGQVGLNVQNGRALFRPL